MTGPEPVGRGESRDSETGAIVGRAFRGVLTLALRGVGIRVLGLAGNIVLTRLLLPRDFGLITFGLTIVNVASFFAGGGVASGLIRREERPTVQELSSMLGLNLMTTMAMVVIVGVVASFTGEIGVIAAVMALSLPIDTIRATNSVLLERDLQYGAIARSQISETLAYNVAAITLVAVGFGVWGLAAAFVIRALLGTWVLLSLGPLGLIRPSFRFGRIRPLIGFGLKFQGATMLSFARDQGVNIMAASVAGLTALGYWTLTSRVLQAIILLFDSLWQVSYPAMSRLKQAGADLRPFLNRAFSRLTVATGFAVVGLSATSPALVPLLFGAHWTPAVPVLPFACLNVMIGGPISAVGFGYLYTSDRVGLVASTTAAQAVIWLGLGAPLTAWLGATGIAISGLATALVIDIGVLGIVIRRLCGADPLRTVGGPFVVACVAVAPSYALGEAMGATVFSLLASGAMGTLIYLAGVWLFFRPDVRELAGFARTGLAKVSDRWRPVAT